MSSDPDKAPGPDSGSAEPQRELTTEEADRAVDEVCAEIAVEMGYTEETLDALARDPEYKDFGQTLD